MSSSPSTATVSTVSVPDTDTDTTAGLSTDARLVANGDASDSSRQTCSIGSAGTAEATPSVVEHAGRRTKLPPLVRLTLGLADTYERVQALQRQR